MAILNGIASPAAPDRNDVVGVVIASPKGVAIPPDLTYA